MIVDLKMKQLREYINLNCYLTSTPERASIMLVQLIKKVW